jgi:hypothetical protein
MHPKYSPALAPAGLEVDPKQAWHWIQSRLSIGSKAGLALDPKQAWHWVQSRLGIGSAAHRLRGGSHSRLLEGRAQAYWAVAHTAKAATSSPYFRVNPACRIPRRYGRVCAINCRINYFMRKNYGVYRIVMCNCG